MVMEVFFGEDLFEFLLQYQGRVLQDQRQPFDWVNNC